MTTRWQLTDDIFNEALNFPPTERVAFLSDACGSDDDLRRDVESLLQYVSDSESYLQAVVDETAREFSASLHVPQVPGSAPTWFFAKSATEVWEPSTSPLAPTATSSRKSR